MSKSDQDQIKSGRQISQNHSTSSDRETYLKPDYDEALNQREYLARQAAVAYYLENQTMEAIHRRLGVSRSTVSRLLAFARERGIVTITVRPPDRPHSKLAKELHDRYAVNAHIIDLPQGMATHRSLEIVGKVAAQRLSQLVQNRDVIGIAWGNTTSEVVQHLPKQNLDEAMVVQLNGAASTETSGLAHAGAILQKMVNQWGASMIHFPVPAFFDNPDTKDALWQEGSVRRVLEWQRRCSVALFGVGALRADMPSHVYEAGYLSPQELVDLEKNGVVGDVCTVLIRADGSWSDIDLNRRATGPNPQKLREIPTRLCVVAGKAKAAALAGAISAGLPTELICDREVAERTLDLLNKCKEDGGGTGRAR